jgi:hypothetical protein
VLGLLRPGLAVAGQLVLSAAPVLCVALRVVRDPVLGAGLFVLPFLLVLFKLCAGRLFELRQRHV